MFQVIKRLENVILMTYNVSTFKYDDVLVKVMVFNRKMIDFH